MGLLKILSSRWNPQVPGGTHKFHRSRCAMAYASLPPICDSYDFFDETAPVELRNAEIGPRGPTYLIPMHVIPAFATRTKFSLFSGKALFRSEKASQRRCVVEFRCRHCIVVFIPLNHVSCECRVSTSHCMCHTSTAPDCSH